MKYGITKLVLGHTPFIDISESEYNDIKLAKENLFEALYIEQKLDIVIDNYLEYEMTAIKSSAHQMLYSNQDYAWFQTDVNNINRRIFNLLSACRLYLDHCDHHLSNIYPNNKDKIKEVTKQKNIEYDNHLSYRVLEALRNYVQHRGYPTQKVKYNRNRIDNGDDWQILFSLTPYLKPALLEKDGKFKKTVLSELKEIGEEIDIKPMIREYITSIGTVHKKIRDILHEDVISWDKTFQDSIQKFKKVDSSDKALGLGAVIQDDRGCYSESVPILSEVIEHRKELEKKNRLVGSLAKFYITNQIIE